MPVPPKPPRPPGAQTPPNAKPFFRPGQTATTHSRLPVHQITDGRRYRVRDKDWTALWGEDLTWDDAVKLKDQVVGDRRSKTARVEDMAVEPPDWFTRQDAEVHDSPSAPMIATVDYASGATISRTVNYAAMSASQMIEACADDGRRWAEAFMQVAGGVDPNEPGDVDTLAAWFANAIEHSVAVRQRRKPHAPVVLKTTIHEPLSPPPHVRPAPHATATHASAQAAQQAQQRHEAQRAQNLPKPPPSPLSDDVIDDMDPGELPPDDQLLDEEDVAGLTNELGANPTETDTARAKVQADKDAAELEKKAKALYEKAARDNAAIDPEGDHSAGQVPPWNRLSERERAAWKYEAQHGPQNGAPRS